MRKYLVFLLLFAVLSACNKHDQQGGCPIKGCTLVFASVSVIFQDKDGKVAFGKDVTAVNVRTGHTIVAKGNGGPIPPSVGPNLFTIATDNNKSEFSAEGDDVKVTATNLETGVVQTFTVKISGGCNCHVAKISGPDVFVFN